MSGHPTWHTNDIKMAVLSDDRRHRYWLTRIWDRSLNLLVVCMFNPSTADAHEDDPTIKRLCKWARAWGYGGILVINLHSYRTSSPAELRQLRPAETWGDAQHEALGHALALAETQKAPVLVAWGALPTDRECEPFWQAAQGLEFICLGVTKAGRPKHPMARGRERVPDDQLPIVYRRNA